ncbi:MAG: hypothetical protein ABEK50_17475 [bacterium]
MRFSLNVSVGLSLLFLAVFSLQGCNQRMTEYVPGKKKDEGELRLAVKKFLSDFERIYELQNRYQLRSILGDNFGGYDNGTDQLINRMDEVFNRFGSVKFNTKLDDFNRSADNTVVTFEWMLTWECTINESKDGCPKEIMVTPPYKVSRQGRTIFYLVESGGGFRIENEEGALLLGSFTPGYQVYP